MWFLIFLANIALLIGVISVFNGYIMAGLVAIAVGAVPHDFAYLARQRKRGEAAALIATVRAQAGHADGGVFEHAQGTTAIAINPARRTLTLASAGQIKTYPLSDVREWSTNLATASQSVMVGGGLASAVAIGSANIAAGARAAAATGMFVSVRDIENPKWRIEMTREADQAKWMEILEQTINEKPGVA